MTTETYRDGLKEMRYQIFDADKNIIGRTSNAYDAACIVINRVGRYVTWNFASTVYTHIDVHRDVFSVTAEIKRAVEAG